MHCPNTGHHNKMTKCSTTKSLTLDICSVERNSVESVRRSEWKWKSSHVVGECGMRHFLICNKTRKKLEKEVEKLTDTSRVCCDMCRRVGMDSIGTPPHRRRTFCPGNLSDNDIWSRHRAARCMCRHCGTAMTRTNFAFHNICLSKEEKLLLLRVGDFVLTTIRICWWIFSYLYILVHTSKRNRLAISMYTNHHFGTAMNRMRCAL